MTNNKPIAVIYVRGNQKEMQEMFCTLCAVEKGYKVVMEPTCAKTIRDNLEQVKSIGIEIADENKDYSNYSKITMGDINITKLSEFLLGYDLEFDFDKIAIAVQDHGYNENMGDRDFRFEKIREKSIWQSFSSRKNRLLHSIAISCKTNSFRCAEVYGKIRKRLRIYCLQNNS